MIFGVEIISGNFKNYMIFRNITPFQRGSAKNTKRSKKKKNFQLQKNSFQYFLFTINLIPLVY